MSKTKARRIACSLASSVMYSYFECAETLNEYSDDDREKIETEWKLIADRLYERGRGETVNRPEDLS